MCNILKVKHACLFLVLVFSFGQISCQKTDYLNYNHGLKVILDKKGLSAKDLSIKIDKSDYKLSICSNDSVIKEYPVVFGGNPTDDKLIQGDGCTPEGTFKIRSKYPHKSWSKFIWIDYPNKNSWKKHNQAKSEGKIPKNAKIGGEIGIHGVPQNADWAIDAKQNWTLGCISLKNKDINEIYPFVNETTTITIQK
jgi:murein L,D-transpeptidase YafK